MTKNTNRLYLIVKAYDFLYLVIDKKDKSYDLFVKQNVGQSIDLCPEGLNGRLF